MPCRTIWNASKRPSLPMYKETCEVLENRPVAPGHFLLKLGSKKIGPSAQPGQFVQILCSGASLDPLLPRPFSFLETNPGSFSILYQVVGQGTRLMEKFKKGDKLPLIGPLGHGFTLRQVTSDQRPATRLLVGGGVGIPPLYHLAKTWVKTKAIKKANIHVFLGARNKALLLCERDFLKIGVHLHLATNDGSKGIKGYVTQVLTKFLKSLVASHSSLVCACGPTSMLKAVSLIASEFGVPCETSVEVPMACGFGACLGCAIKVKGDTPGSYRFAIACTEGPVFEGSKVLWD